LNSVIPFSSGLSAAIALFYCLNAINDQRRAPPSERTPSLPLNADDRLHRQLAAIGATRTSRGWMVTLSVSRFQSGKAQLECADVDKVERIAFLLKVHSRLRIVIAADTHNRSTPAYNDGLLQGLADTVLCNLIECGADAARIRTRVQEENSSVGCVETAKVRQLHGRIQILFSDAEGEFNSAARRRRDITVSRRRRSGP